MQWLPVIPLDLIVTDDGESFKTIPEGSTGLPTGQHPGAFGVRRKNHIHEGVDLYCPYLTPVSTAEDGVVVAVIDFTGQYAEPPSPWWNDTQAVLVEGLTGVIVYGEIKPKSDISPGDTIKAGTIIGYVIPVLKKDKGRPMTMLHLELHKHGTRDAHVWDLNSPRPDSLLDPTSYLSDEHG